MAIPGLEENDLAVNNATRIPVALCIDTSESMGWGNKLGLLNDALKDFYSEMRSNRLTKYAIDIATIKFSDVVIPSKFESVRIGQVPQITKATGQTHLAEAVEKGIDLLEKRKEEYSQSGVEYYQPWLVILTDGRSEGETINAVPNASRRSRELEAARKLTVIPGYIGDEEAKDLEALSSFSAVNKAQKFNAKDLKSFFRWLSASFNKITASGTENAPLISFSSFVPGLASLGDII